MQTLPTARYWGRRPQAAGNTLYTGVRDIDLLDAPASTTPPASQSVAAAWSRSLRAFDERLSGGARWLPLP